MRDPGEAIDPPPPTEWMWVVCAVAALVPIWSVKYLPMTDLPHHAAQVAIWARYDDPTLQFSRWFTIHRGSPYLAGYALARAATPLVGVGAALKLTISAVVLALPLALERLVGVAGGDRRWALLGFPLAYGVSFYWGLLNFYVAGPLAVLLLAEGVRYAARPTVRMAAWLATLATVLYLAHALAFAFAGGLVGLVVVATSPRARAVPLRLLPLSVPSALGAAWALANAGDEGIAHTGIVWGWTPSRAISTGLLFGIGPGALAAAAGAALLAAVVLARRPHPERWAYLPLVATLAAFLLGPETIHTAGLLPERLAMFIVPTALLALRPTLRWRHAGWAFVAFVVGWSLLLGHRFGRFDDEARDLDAVLERMEPARSVVALSRNARSRHVAGWPYLHFGGWYQATKGGDLAHSFADLFPSVARHRDAYRRSPLRSLDEHPDAFDESIDGAWDYYLVRAAEDPGAWLAPRVRSGVCAEPPSGEWHLYRRSDTPRRPGAAIEACTAAAAQAPVSRETRPTRAPATPR